jgi:hypothetical protein
MKVERKKPKEEFLPIHIVIETEEEARVLWMLLNCNYDFIKKLGANDTRCRVKTSMWHTFNRCFPQ